ncbi:uncharacterized protein [Aegilops tauschii subsp. strangulata]|uniref:uncharacterized protein isoform X2 n=1 Tax=Aegilops tauschii subsp. strangulata TaxID=200361 RepID=UPI001ABD34B4|nr:uncharacterized protein LOC109764219 [Aegilops tauschii subsp. strangulata]
MLACSHALVYLQTSKRKRVIAEPEGAPAKSLKNVVVPEKSDSTLVILVIQPVTQNVGPTPVDCTHTSLATPLAAPHRTCTPAKGMPISVAIAPAVPQKNPTPAKSTASPSAEDLSQLQRRPIPADWNPIPVIPSLKDNAFNVVRDYVHIFPSWEDYSEDKHHFHIFLSHLRARVNLDSHDEQSLLMLFKEALQQYWCYLRKSHFDGKSLNEFLVKSPVLNLEDIEWENFVMHWSRSEDEEICSKKNSGLKRTTGYRKYAARCFALNKGNAYEENSVVNFLNCPPSAWTRAL